MLRPVVNTHTRAELTTFQLVSTAPGRHATPHDIDFAAGIPAPAPCTVAHALAHAGALDLSHPPDLDGQDHWFAVPLPPALHPGPRELVFEGLATLAEVWLDGVRLLVSDSMFVPHALPLPEGLRDGAQLVLCFRALCGVLAERRPRPRWRTRLVDSQQLRYVRTSLLGRTPGFCPSVPVVGAHRPVLLVAERAIATVAAQLQAGIAEGRAFVEVVLTFGVLAAYAPAHATLIVAGPAGSGSVELALSRAGGTFRAAGRLVLTEFARWWPHTHGAQPLSAAHVALTDGVVVALGTVGFRTLAVDRAADGQGFGLVVNGVPVFARGACWTTDDLLSLGSAGLADTLSLASAAGMNMLRVGGTAAYETDAFHALCDERGILVFQDFMFANMDYPSADPAFMASVEAEARALLVRIGHRPSLGVLCGGSEVQQQAAMLGLTRDAWQSPLFDALLPRLCAELAPDVPYLPSTPSGGALPFQTDAGVCHYYGVGAYLRPLDDARRSQVRFAAECLAFANVPCADTIARFMGDLAPPHHHPRWKERVPRDRGAGWDFEDVRDHYIRLLFGVEPRDVRYADPERYLALGHAAVGEAMHATLTELRRAASPCRGALVFWLKDLWPGAGWGVIDALGAPKSAYHYLARAMAPLALLATDEGLNGVHLHVHHDGPVELSADLTVALYRDGETPVAEHAEALQLGPRSAARLSVDALLGRFCDSAYAYRFGPPAHDLVYARLRDAHGRTVHAFHLPLGLSRARERDLGLSASFDAATGGVRVRTRRFAQCVALDVPGFRPHLDHFHLEPGGERLVALTPLGGHTGPARGSVSALNATAPVTIRRESLAAEPQGSVAKQ